MKNGRKLERVLYVEDEPDIQAVADLALGAIGGLVVKVCGSGKEALAEAPDFHPDMILLDVMMPGMDGPATLAAIRADARLAGTPVVFISARVQTREVAEYRRLGALDVIAKPFDPMSLADRLREIWRNGHEA